MMAILRTSYGPMGSLYGQDRSIQRAERCDRACGVRCVGRMPDDGWWIGQPGGSCCGKERDRCGRVSFP